MSNVEEYTVEKENYSNFLEYLGNYKLSPEVKDQIWKFSLNGTEAKFLLPVWKYKEANPQAIEDLLQVEKISRVRLGDFFNQKFEEETISIDFYFLFNKGINVSINTRRLFNSLSRVKLTHHLKTTPFANFSQYLILANDKNSVKSTLMKTYWEYGESFTFWLHTSNVSPVKEKLPQGTSLYDAIMSLKKETQPGFFEFFSKLLRAYERRYRTEPVNVYKTASKVFERIKSEMFERYNSFIPFVVKVTDIADPSVVPQLEILPFNESLLETLENEASVEIFKITGYGDLKKFLEKMPPIVIAEFLADLKKGNFNIQKLATSLKRQNLLEKKRRVKVVLDEKDIDISTFKPKRKIKLKP